MLSATRNLKNAPWLARRGTGRVFAMRKGFRDGQHYRARADECRAIAEQFLHYETREKMLQLAAEYEEIADFADDLVRDVRELKLPFDPHAPRRVS